MKPVTFTRAALKALRKMPADVAEQIMGEIEQYAANPDLQANNITALKGREGIRLRVGDWRVIMNDAGVVLPLLDPGPRGSI